MDNNNFIIENMDNPHELERMYRKDPEDFKKAFYYAWEQNADSQVLKAWYERLYFKERVNKEESGSLKNSFFIMMILAILSGISSRVLLHFVEKNAITPINMIFGVVPFIAGYFMLNNKSGKKIAFTIMAILIVTAIYINILPKDYRDTVILAYLHLPVFLWALLGFAFVGKKYNVNSTRLAYLKFNGEFLILYGIMAISGMILTLISTNLFAFVRVDIYEFYFKNVVLFGATALALVATHLVARNMKLAKNIAPYIAKIFSPIVLITLVFYLVAVIVSGENTFIDRNFLMRFNAILLFVLVVTIFSITESSSREKRGISHYINFTLILVALIIDSIALSSIVFRLSSYGITPNRIAVLGVNLVVWSNLIWIMLSYIKFLKNKDGIEVVQKAITKYLPIYGLWAAIVVIIFPIIF